MTTMLREDHKNIHTWRFANPLRQPQKGVANIHYTDPVLLRIMFHEAQATWCPLISQVQTQEELEELIGDFSSLRQVLKSSSSFQNEVN